MISPVQQKLIDASLAPANLASEVNTSVAAKVLDSARQEGAAVLKLLDAAALPLDPSRGATLDVVA